ncbi:isoaspartyl peptidase [Acutalibacter sp. 1XD8-36]|nr:isoaspartyl peptidase [Acutalibacter sp. 1XD8-36]
MYKRYIVRQRARFQSVFEGRVNLPWGTVVDARLIKVSDDPEPERWESFLFLGSKLLCAASAQNTKDFFVQDDDGQGETRGRLVTAILARLDPQKAHQEASIARWEKIWADRRCRAYKRPGCPQGRSCEPEEHWIWTDDFYNAPIGDLQHIADLVGAKI